MSATDTTERPHPMTALQPVSDGPRSRLGESWVGFATTLRREIHRVLRIWPQTLLPPVITTSLYFIIFGPILGNRIGEMEGFTYLQYVTPGLIMMAVLTNAFTNSSSSLIIAKVQGSIVDVLMPPLSAAELTVAIVAGAATRGLMVGAITAATCAVYMALFGIPMGVSNFWAILYFSASAAVIFGAIGAIGGIWADKFDQMAAITNFVITPLTFLSGTFYSVANLPEPFLTISHYNPVYYLIDGFRSGFTGVAEAPIWIGVSSTLVLALGFTIACYLLIRSGYKLKD